MRCMLPLQLPLLLPATAPPGPGRFPPPRPLQMTRSSCSASTQICPGGGGPLKSVGPFSLALFAGTGFTYVRYLRHKSRLSMSSGDAAQPRPVVIAGPSGVGKGTLIELLRKKYPAHFGFSVSHTTRKPREGEQDGVHYNFTTVDAIKGEIDAGKFVEYANVHGNYYGTSVAAVESVQCAGKICILDIDVQGVRNVKKSSLDAIYVFVAPPSMEELKRRLRGRGTETEEAMAKRLGNAREEMEYGTGEGNFDRVFTNDDLDTTFAAMAGQFREWYPQLKE